MNEIMVVRDLQTHFFTRDGTIKAVDGVSFSVGKGEVFGLVGESGSGKTVTALSIMRLIPEPPGKIVNGQIYFEEEDLLSVEEKRMREIRGRKISMIFQEPMTALDPVFTIGHEIMEAVRLHQGLKPPEAREVAVESLKVVGIPDPQRRLKSYPHELSGGMRQRVMIAMALSCGPSLLIADEPTTALDVTIQAQILALINELKAEFDMSVMLITHDLGIIAEMCNSAAIMYAGQVMEYASVDALFNNPLHPYTRGLHRSMPRLDIRRTRLETIKGSVPNLLDLPSGCPFHPRCEFCVDECSKAKPSLREVDPHHWVRCHLQ
jgi:oligopeptide/dipeptide ABC transporter ATP-binding protein